MTDLQAAARYLPVFCEDELEPFPVQAIGFTVFTQSGKSPSSAWTIRLGEDTAFAVEYAVYLDFDIQHLYDLEHAFVYVGRDGAVTRVEASFHGHFYRSDINGDLQFEGGTHPLLYLQPGKHGVMPDPKYFQLYRDLTEACGTLAGADGFLVVPMFADRLHTDPETNALVRDFIREQYAFEPSLRFRRAAGGEELLMTWEQLDRQIPPRMEQRLAEIREWGKRRG